MSSSSSNIPTPEGKSISTSKRLGRAPPLTSLDLNESIDLSLLGTEKMFLFNAIIVWVSYYTVPTTSLKETPVLVATKVRPMKLIDLAGLTKMSARNSFRSITSGVLFVSSHMSKKS